MYWATIVLHSELPLDQNSKEGSGKLNLRDAPHNFVVAQFTWMQRLENSCVQWRKHCWRIDFAVSNLRAKQKEAVVVSFHDVIRDRRTHLVIG